MVRTVSVRYPAARALSTLVVGPGAVARLGRLARRHLPGAERALIVTDSRVGPLHAAAVRRALRRAGLAVAVVTVPAGERSKSAAQLVRLWNACAAGGLGRRDVVVALGGGVVGDLAGFAAATWLRGVRWIGVPTSLLAQVDSSVGGKTAVDLAAGKNLAGAFHQPALVVVDASLLRTLPARHVRAGLAEVVKMGFATDAGLFRWCERRADALAARDPRALAGAVARGLAAKLRVVRADEREREGGPRTALNFGHTLAHALERVRAYRGVLHGEAVAVGMRAAAALSELEAGLGARDRARLLRVLDAIGLRHRLRGVRARDLVAAMAHDKKRAGARVRWVLTPRLGHASVPRSVGHRSVIAVLVSLGAET